MTTPSKDIIIILSNVEKEIMRLILLGKIKEAQWLKEIKGAISVGYEIGYERGYEESLEATGISS